MSKEEKSLLLFLECRAVDYAGRVEIVHMNTEDMKIVERWNEEGFVKFGRIAFANLTEGRDGTHWCYLSDEAWQIAATERKDRAERLWIKRLWKTIEEKRNE